MSRLQQVQSQRMVQKLELKPKMLQSLQMLQMPIMQLEIHLKQELINNPMMELQEDDQEPTPVESNLESEVDDELKKTIEEAKELSEILDHWNDYHQSDRSYSKVSDESVSPELFMKAKENKKNEFIDQIKEEDFTEMEYDFILDLLDTADSHGYLPKDFNIYDLGSEYDLTEERINELHQIILNLSPRGITARSIEECLEVQLDKDIKHYDLIKSIIHYDFQNLIHRRYQQLSSKYQVSQDVIHQCKEQVAHLDPKPGLRILTNEVNYIVPDVIIKKIENEFEVIVNDFSMPNIVLSRRYSNIVKKLNKDRNAINFVRDKISSAKFLIKSMYMRNRTLERVTKSIIDHQRSFFYENSGILDPLTYSTIAAELQVNESTISRVVRQKYADTPFGVMCLKDFFTSTAGKDKNYEAVSRQQVQTVIIKLIETEDPRSPLSDQQIVKILKQRGISVSRRVIAKYRESLGILNSRLRRKD